VAEDWYLQLRGKLRAGEIKTEKTFREASELFLREYDIITFGQRSKDYVRGQHSRSDVHLVPFFGKMGLSEITSGKVQEYRIHRLEETIARRGKPPAHNTMHQEFVTLRQTLKTALRHGWLDRLPDLSEPYRSSSKISHRAWFSPDEYKKLYEATRQRAQHPKQERFRWEGEQLHDYVLFSANTGLRPDEARRLQFRDVTIVEDEAMDKTILEIDVRGKRGVGYCKSMPGAVRPFERLKMRLRPPRAEAGVGEGATEPPAQWRVPGPTDLLFPKWQRELFNAILDEENLRSDREGQPRTAYSLRHTYICLRLMEGADIYQIAKSCRTSVEMIEKYYASHIKTQIDAAAVNIMRKKPKNKKNGKQKPNRPTPATPETDI
jgi:integrase